MFFFSSFWQTKRIWYCKYRWFEPVFCRWNRKTAIYKRGGKSHDKTSKCIFIEEPKLFPTLFVHYLRFVLVAMTSDGAFVKFTIIYNQSIRIFLFCYFFSFISLCREKICIQKASDLHSLHIVSFMRTDASVWKFWHIEKSLKIGLIHGQRHAERKIEIENVFQCLKTIHDDDKQTCLSMF